MALVLLDISLPRLDGREELWRSHLRRCQSHPLFANRVPDNLIWLSSRPYVYSYV
jgi:hypothetical protein